jgi:hypothetical protein
LTFTYSIVILSLSVRGCVILRLLWYRGFHLRVWAGKEPGSGCKGLDMGKRWLLSWMRCGVVAPLRFLNNNDIRYSTQTWLRKAMDIVESNVGDVK